MGLLRLLKNTFDEFLADDCPRMAAALSYYIVFALPPLLVLLLVVLGTVVDPTNARTMIQEQFAALTGPGVADQIGSIVEQARQPGAGRGLTAVLGAGALLFGATGAFVQLQGALNRAWDVAPNPDEGGVRGFLFKRVLSIGMVMAIAFLLLVSLVLSALISAFGDLFASYVSAGISDVFMQVVNTVVSLAVFTVLFAAMYRFLPDAKIEWRQVWVGAGVTTLLLMLGKTVIGIYLGNADPGQAYGAASSLAVLLLWIYYSSMIVLFGAEFTEVWTERHGRVVEPSRGAVRVHPERHPRPPSGPAPERA
jgi:membrane protein